MKRKQVEKHEFALYIDTLSAEINTDLSEDVIIISDETVVHRIATVLRLTIGDQCVLFDKNMHAQVIIKDIIKQRQLSCLVVSKNNNTIQKPDITFLLPILKRDDLETALYSLTEIGVTTIQLVSTEKMHHMPFGKKEMERARRVIVAAAEQSKNFAYPELKEPVTLSKACDMCMDSEKLFFDKGGDRLFNNVQRLHDRHFQNITLLVGPEGDLSNEEKEMVVSKQFMTCELTSTVLRSVQAVALSAGMVRSLLM